MLNYSSRCKINLRIQKKRIIFVRCNAIKVLIIKSKQILNLICVIRFSYSSLFILLIRLVVGRVELTCTLVCYTYTCGKKNGLNMQRNMNMKSKMKRFEFVVIFYRITRENLSLFLKTP